MNTKRKQLLKKLTEETEKFTGNSALLCGHYPLVLNGDSLTFGIYQEIQNQRISDEMKMHPYSGEFPLETFKIGTELLCSMINTKMVSLVNDWQFVPKNETGDSTPNVFREHFYKTQTIPEVYRGELDKNGFGEEVFLMPPKKYQSYDSRFHFSETKLRNQFNNVYKPTCSLENSCAQEFVPFLVALSEAGISNLIALIPGTCQKPTCDGIAYAINGLGLKINILSAYFYNTTSKEKFWDDVWVFKNGESEFLID